MSPESIVIYGLIAFVVVKVGAVVCALIAGAQAGKERSWYPQAPSLDKSQEQRKKRQGAIAHAKESGQTCFLMESNTGNIYRFDRHPAELADLILPNGWYSIEGKTLMMIFQQVAGSAEFVRDAKTLLPYRFGHPEMFRGEQVMPGERK